MGSTKLQATAIAGIGEPPQLAQKGQWAAVLFTGTCGSSAPNGPDCAITPVVLTEQISVVIPRGAACRSTGQSALSAMATNASHAGKRRIIDDASDKVRGGGL